VGGLTFDFDCDFVRLLSLSKIVSDCGVSFEFRFAEDDGVCSMVFWGFSLVVEDLTPSNFCLKDLTGVSRPFGVTVPFAAVESFSGADLLGVRGFGVSDPLVELRNDRFEGVAGNLAELSGSEEVSEGTEAIDSVLLRFLLVPFVPFVVAFVGVPPFTDCVRPFFLPVSTDALVDFLASTSSPSDSDSLK